ncbi:3-ketoacyl-ACP reductase [Mycobacterium saskatchewanense]|uniref:3-ketoacyl-ACP reductase n=1 Tax=Mycobacterium saskatchewanense TaxID=220927 RepID=A0AAJ3NTB3_9MYCO|nr:SDR family oxidoreductase [Mycobacterium saskatchewanense]ORW74922.1 3-ketoacyl-ACP reductase [Mycobacterium saskatchewanense]BBX63627.1 3-ketoacyl-ACP reductase [Mycobacterium saskatchewanense]
MDSLHLTGKTAVVTGASRGIGHAAAWYLSRLGADVVLTARTQQAADAAAAETVPGAVGFAAHATDADAAGQCIDFTLERFGRLDILVNNAATNAAYGPLVDQHYDGFRKTIDLNLWAPILWSSLAARAWMSAHGGTIVNTASLGGLTTEPNLGIYNVSKAALIHFTKQCAVELAPSVRVNAVAPGVVRTKLSEVLWRDREHAVADSLPLGRIGEPEDIGQAIAFLASDAAAWITGQVLVIDGGAIL